MNSYQIEQAEATVAATSYLSTLSGAEMKKLHATIRPYLAFRAQVDKFLAHHCSDACRLSCYTSKNSACCSKDGIIVFWADILINACCSTKRQMQLLMERIRQPWHPQKCIYLSANGCNWQTRPLVCAMFLCDSVEQEIIESDTHISAQWAALQSQAKTFRWPDQPVLFDQLEQCCIAAGIKSPLMYLNNSPGLLRVKQKAGYTSHFDIIKS